MTVNDLVFYLKFLLLEYKFYAIFATGIIIFINIPFFPIEESITSCDGISVTVVSGSISWFQLVIGDASNLISDCMWFA